MRNPWSMEAHCVHEANDHAAVFGSEFTVWGFEFGSYMFFLTSVCTVSPSLCYATYSLNEGTGFQDLPNLDIKPWHSQVRGTILIPSTRSLQPGGHRHLQHGFGGVQEVQQPAKGSAGVGASDASVGRFRVGDLGFRV